MSKSQHDSEITKKEISSPAEDSVLLLAIYVRSTNDLAITCSIEISQCMNAQYVKQIP